MFSLQIFKVLFLTGSLSIFLSFANASSHHRGKLVTFKDTTKYSRLFLNRPW